MRLQREYLWILSVVPVAIWSVAGVVLLAVAALQAWSPSGRGAGLRDAGILVVCFALFVPLVNLGSYITERLKKYKPLLSHPAGYKTMGRRPRGSPRDSASSSS